MSSSTPRHCPACAAHLVTIVHEGVDVDRCPAGHGLWLDKGELRAVVVSEDADRPREEEIAALDKGARDHGQALLAEAQRGPRTCPVCTNEMRITEYARSGVAIDECIQHGVWLDDGELERIEAYAEGIRHVGRSGAAGASGRTTVAGLDVPAELLATIRTANVPPPA